MKQIIHSKFKPMKKEPLFVALSNQKGGVGKSTFTVLLASYFHYLKGYNVLVVDCDYPQHSISTMRDWEVGSSVFWRRSLRPSHRFTRASSLREGAGA